MHEMVAIQLFFPPGALIYFYIFRTIEMLIERKRCLRNDQNHWKYLFYYIGFYSAAGSIDCTVCPAGSYCPLTNNATVIACANGYFSLDGATACTMCPPGLYNIFIQLYCLSCRQDNFA